MKNKFKKFCIGLSLLALLGGCATMTPVKTTSKAGLEKELTETEKELMDIRKNGIKGKDKSFYGMEREDTIFYELDKIAEDELNKCDKKEVSEEEAEKTRKELEEIRNRGYK